MKTDIKSVLAWGKDYLTIRKIDTPEIDSEVILSEVLGMKRTELYINSELELSNEKMSEYNRFMRRRGRKYPVSYIFGYAVFMGLRFKVTKDTLIPRPETELLVEKCLEYIGKKNPVVIEIGTGCGNIAVTLAKFAGVKVFTVEKNVRALNIAKFNAEEHGVTDKIKFIAGDMFYPFGKKYDSFFDLLISNPPYVKSSEYVTIQNEVKKEPRTALLGGKDGLKYASIILKEGSIYLRNGGRIFMEIGYNQKREVEKIIKREKYISDFKFIKDYSGIDRILTASVDD